MLTTEEQKAALFARRCRAQAKQCTTRLWARAAFFMNDVVPGQATRQTVLVFVALAVPWDPILDPNRKRMCWWDFIRSYKNSIKFSYLLSMSNCRLSIVPWQLSSQPTRQPASPPASPVSTTSQQLLVVRANRKKHVGQHDWKIYSVQRHRLVMFISVRLSIP